MLLLHGNVHPRITGFHQRRWNATGFAAEQQPIIVLKSKFAVVLAALGAEGNPAAGPGYRFEAIDGVVLVEVDVGPVIQPSALELAVRNFKTEGANQVQGGCCGRTGPGDVAGVGRNLGLDENEAKHGERQIKEVSPCINP